MPYLKEEKDRKTLDSIIEIHGKLLTKPGAINYLLFKLAKVSCNRYQNYRNFIGELECCKQEIYRRQTGPYEDTKIYENGDVE